MFDLNTALQKIETVQSIKDLMDIVENTSAKIENSQGKEFILYSNTGGLKFKSGVN